MTLEDYRTTLIIACVLLLLFDFVNGMLWARMIDKHRLPNGWLWRVLTLGCTLTPLAIWAMLFFSLASTAKT